MKHKVKSQNKLAVPKRKSGWLYTVIILGWPILAIGTATALAELSQSGAQQPPDAQWGDLGQILLVTVLGIALLGLGALIIYARACRRVHRQHIRAEHKAINYLNIADSVILALDASARVTFINQAGCRVFGYARDEIIGRNWIDTLIAPEQRDKIRDSFQRMIGGDTGHFAHLDNFELLTKDGTKRLTSWHNAPIRNERGEITGTLSSGEDITERVQIEDALRDNAEHKATNYLDIAGSVILALDASARVTFINQAGCRVFGYARDELIGRNWIDTLIAPEQRDKIRDSFQRMIGGDTGHFAHLDNFELLTKDGTKRLTSWHNAPIRNERGEITGTLSSGEDITERVQIEDALRDNAEHKATNYLNIAGSVILALDASARVTFINQAGCRVFGYARDELIGRNWIDTLIAPEQRDKIRDSFQRMIGGDTGHFAHLDNFELLTKDGTKRLTSWHNAPIRNERGEITGTLSSGEDITERVQIEDALRDNAEHKATNYLNIAGSVILALDASARVTFINQAGCRVFGYARDELIGRNWIDTLIAPEQRDKIRDSFQRMIGGDTGHFAHLDNFELLTKDGTKRLTSWHNAPIRNERGEITGTLSSGEDITERVQIEDALRDNAEHKAINYLDIAGSVILALDASARVTFINQAGCRVFGYARDELIGRNWIDTLIAPEQRDKIRDSFQRMIGGDTGHFAHLDNFELLTKVGTKRLTSWHNVPIRNERGEITGTLCSGEDITERVQIDEELRENKDRLVELAHYDYLTKLPNRPLFHDRLKHAIAQAHRTRDQVALLLLDLDRFKNINDTLGHLVGDQYLKVVANRLRSCMREGDTVARFAGDEFVVILDKIASPRDAKVVAEKLLRDLSRPVYVENNELKTTTSIGISFYPSGGSTVDELLKTADAAMYQAKEHGRNTYQFFTEDMNDKAREWLALETDLQQALDKGQLVVHYQPQYDLGTGTLVGMEALLRWQHPTRGLMEPRNFIPLAEETGQIMGIGNWVLRTACAQNLQWQEQGYSPVKVSVNLSSRQFQQKHLAATVDKILRETGLQAKYLELEFKESIVMEDAEAAVFTLIELRCLGISLVIDDFGMGYSSLNHLKRFPLDKLKIDGSFVRKITSDANDAAITAATIALAHNMGLHVIAESVENEIQADFLSKQGCDDAQGYYYSQPKTAEQCAELLEKLGPEQRDRLQLSDPDS